VITNFGNACNINSIALEPGNKVVAVGNYSNGSTSDFAIARYLTNGSLDTSFNGNGEVTSNFGNSDNAISVGIQTDGKIVVGGYYTDPSFNSHVEIARYNPGGSIDLTFNGTGLTGTNFGNAQEYLAAIVLQNNGGIVAGGYTYNINGFPELALVRFKGTGIVDSSFGVNGQVLDSIGPSFYNFMNCLTLTKTGQILAGGYSENGNGTSFTLSLFNSSGSLVTGFASGGNVLGFFPGNAIYYGDIMVQKDAKFVVKGYTYNGTTVQNFLARFTPNGAVDPNYGTGGTANTNGYNAVMQSDGKVVESNSYNAPDSFLILMSRYNSNGSPDLSYGTNGIVISDFFGQNQSYGPTAIQPDNKVVMAGYIDNNVGTDVLLIRYDTTGSPDPSFGTGGAVIADYEMQDYAQAIAIGGDGKILVAGVGYTASYQLVMFFARFNKNGSVDSSFAQKGFMIISIGVEVFPGTVAFQNDGKLLLAYETSYDYNTFNSFITRYKSNGTVDSSFGVNGTIPVDGPGVILESDQKLLVSGTVIDAQNNVDFSVARFKPNGSIDKSFANNGKTITTFTPGSNYEGGDAISNNELLAGGYSNDPAAVGIIAEYQLGDPSLLAGPANLIVPTDDGLCSAKINGLEAKLNSLEPPEGILYQLSGATEGNGLGSVSGTVFNKGVTDVKYSLASDSSLCYHFTITVEDREAPQISDVNHQLFNPSPGDSYLDLLLNYTVTDNCGLINNRVSISDNYANSDNESYSFKKSNDWQIIDDHHIRLNVATQAMNSAQTQKIFTIQVLSTDLSGNQSTKTDTLIIPETSGDFMVIPTPNPSHTAFGINVISKRNDVPVTLQLMDEKGMQVQSISNMAAGQTVFMGGYLPPGIYLLRAMQGNSIKTIKLIKY
jgi:uncharacterized delta-60 repeat protein